MLLAGNGAIYDFCPYTKMLNHIQVTDGWTIKDLSMQETNDNMIDLLILAEDAKHQLYAKIVEYKSEFEAFFTFYKFDFTFNFCMCQSNSAEYQMAVAC